MYVDTVLVYLHVDLVVTIQRIGGFSIDLFASPQDLWKACEGVIEDEKIVVDPCAQLCEETRGQSTIVF